MIIAIALFLGKGSWLIAGYNTASEEEKAKYDKKKLCPSMGTLCFITAVLIFIMTYFCFQVETGILQEKSLLIVAIVFCTAIVCAIVVEIIYVNKFCKMK